MTHEEYRGACLNVIWLAGCAARGQVPDAARIGSLNLVATDGVSCEAQIGSMDLSALYQAAKRHMLEAIVGYALESAGIEDLAFSQAKAKAIRKNIIMDTERAVILQKMSAVGIWHMPLKGAVLAPIYPAVGMRQMSDNDILFDASRAEDVRAIMEEQGFQTEAFGLGNHDTYHKEPVSNFEMHRVLFGESDDERFWDYYRDVRDRLLKDDGETCGYHFRAEDFYIYMTAHEYKHYAGGGTGMRSLVDTWVYCTSVDRREYGAGLNVREKCGLQSDGLDWDYIDGELEKLGIAEFERMSRELAFKLFGGEALAACDLTVDELAMLDYILFSGTYGTTGHRVNNRVNQLGGGTTGKARYLLRRVFLPMKSVKACYPTFAKYPILLPILPAYRFTRGIIKYNGKKRLKAELKALSDRGR